MGRPFRASLLDGFLVVLTCLQLLELWLARPAAHTVSGVLLTVMSTASLLLRHRSQFAAAAGCLAAHAMLVQLQPDGLSTTFFALIVAMAVIGAGRTGVAVAGLLCGLCIAAEGAWLDVYGGGLADFAMGAAVLAGAWLAGAMLARHGRVAAVAQMQAREAEEASRRAGEEAVVAERARLTRDLHDVVAHGLTVVVVQSVAAQEDLAHGEATTSLPRRLAEIEETARQSLSELRMLLGILGEPAEQPLVRPSAGMSGIDALVEQARAAGVATELRVAGDPRPLAPGIELTTYRVAQEALTNVLKHGGRQATVLVRYEPHRVDVEVLSDLAAEPASAGVPGAGRGLAGLRERVGLYSGTFEAGPSPQGFRVRCALPLSASLEAQRT
jgi:signal transduction histidine kinase